MSEVVCVLETLFCDFRVAAAPEENNLFVAKVVFTAEIRGYHA